MNIVKSRTTKLLCLLLCLVMLVPFALTACGGDGGDGDETTKAPTSTKKPSEDQDPGDVEIIDPAVEDWVEIYDMGVDGGARQITFATHEKYNQNYYFFRHEGDVDVDAGDVLAMSAKTRTLFIEEKFNVAFNVLEYNGLYTVVEASLMGNGGEYDLLYPHPTGGMMNFLTNGLFQNLYNFDAIDLSKPWWNQAQVQEFTIDDKLYIAVNDMSICGQGFVGIVYNRNLYNELKLGEDLYSMVYDGQWTVGVLKTLAMAYGEGAGADMVLNYDDKIGFMCQSNAWYWNFGGRVISKDKDGEFYIAIDSTESDAISGALYDLLWNTEDHVWVVDEYFDYASHAMSKTLANFKQGNSLFYSYDLGGLYKNLWGVNFEVGYLPPPMLNIDQDDYYSPSSSGFFAIPQKVTDNKATSTLLEALAIHSYTNHRKTFFETILLSRMSEKPADYKMLSFIYDTKCYDWGSHLFVDSQNKSNTFITYFAHEQKQPSVSNYVKSRIKVWENLLKNVENIRNGKFGG
ncbi:MAG: hypothetical protein IKB75_02865 [Clostridia bacterium]|nr:hypothetical protein [Clostridia bacterium]